MTVTLTVALNTITYNPLPDIQRYYMVYTCVGMILKVYIYFWDSSSFQLDISYVLNSISMFYYYHWVDTCTSVCGLLVMKDTIHPTFSVSVHY